MSETLCGRPVTERVFWPGKPPLAMCYKHAYAAKNIAAAMGLYLYTEPAEPALDGEGCTNVVEVSP